MKGLSKKSFHYGFFMVSLLMVPIFFSVPPCACADEPESIFLIIDSSAGMSDKIEGRPKMDVLKEVLTRLVKEIPNSLNVGLIVFGHRKKADCSDVEQIVPLALLDKKRIIKAMTGLKPKGKAPITMSILKVFDKVDTFEEKCTIILVTGCQDTCAGKPCELIKKLKKMGLRFIIHVISFAVSTKGQASLSCIAEAGGGLYYPVKNSTEFLTAARHIIGFESVRDGPALCVAVVKNGVSFPAHISIRKNGRIIATGDTSIRNPVKFYLVAGKYRIIARDISMDGKKTRRALVDFNGTESFRLFNFSNGILKVSVLKDGLPAEGYIYVRRPGTMEPVTTGDTSDSNPVIIRLQPGSYDVAAIDPETAAEPSLYFSGIKVKAGELLEKVIHFTGRPEE